MEEYLRETAEHKRERTFAAYTETLSLYLKCLSSIAGKHVEESDKPRNGKPTMEERVASALFLDRPHLLASAVAAMQIGDVSRESLLEYKSYLGKRGNEPRTVRNRVDYLQIFLHHFGLPSVLKGKDLPKYTEKKVRAYNPREIALMFEHATVDEADLLHFLLGTGARKQEQQYVCWPDLDLVSKTLTVTEHLDLGYIPKDSEEGTFPIPDILVEHLTARRKRYPKTRLVFPGKNNEPDDHALRIIKRLALRSGVNCSYCFNKNGLSCANYPVCRHVILHKMRKTYATMLHRNGVPARTIMGYLRHSDLETTLRYLADGDDEQTREKINLAFGAFGRSTIADVTCATTNSGAPVDRALALP